VATDEQGTPGGKRKGQRLRLKSLMDVREEMARVYRDMRAEKIQIGAGNGLVQVLMYLAKATEMAQGAGLIERLDELESRRVSTPDASANPPTN
jgi:hypothetical protein